MRLWRCCQPGDGENVDSFSSKAFLLSMRSQNRVCLQSITPVWPPAAFPKGDYRNISECKEHLPSKFKAMEVMLSVWARARKAIPPCASSWSFQLLKPFRSYQFPIFGRNNSESEGSTSTEEIRWGMQPQNLGRNNDSFWRCRIWIPKVHIIFTTC